MVANRTVELNKELNKEPQKEPSKEPNKEVPPTEANRTLLLIGVSRTNPLMEVKRNLLVTPSNQLAANRTEAHTKNSMIRISRSKVHTASRTNLINRNKVHTASRTNLINRNKAHMADIIQATKVRPMDIRKKMRQRSRILQNNIHRNPPRVINRDILVCPEKAYDPGTILTQPAPVNGQPKRQYDVHHHNSLYHMGKAASKYP